MPHGRSGSRRRRPGFRLPSKMRHRHSPREREIERERALAEQELRRCKKMFEKAQELTKTGCWEFDVAARRTRWSDELYRILGYAPGEIEPSFEAFARHVHPGDLENFSLRSKKDGRGDYGLIGTPGEYRIMARGGGLLWVLGNTEAEYDWQGRVTRVSGTVQDITARRQMENALRESESKFKGLFLESSDGIVLYDSAWRIISWNRAVEKISGRPAEDFIGRDMFDMIIEFLPAEYRTREMYDFLRGHIRDHLSTRESSDGEFMMSLPDGTKKIITYAMFRIPIDGGFIYGSTMRDITEMRRAEERSDRLGRILEESLNELYILDGRTLRFIMANRGARDNLGYSMHELSGLTFMSVNVEFTPADFAARVEPLRSGSRGSIQFETVIRRKDGSQYQAEIRLHLARLNNDEILVANVLDITQRKLAQDAIRKSEERFRAIFNNAGIGISLFDRQGRYIQVNSRWAEMLGYAAPELLAMSHFQVMPPEERDSLQHKLSELNGGSIDSYFAERRFIRRGGEIFWANCAATALPDGKGGIAAIISLAADVTDRKKAEQEREELIADLTEALKQIRALRGLLPICSSCKKIRDDRGYWNAIEQYIMEHSEAEFTHGICPDCLKKYYPEACEDPP